MQTVVNGLVLNRVLSGVGRLMDLLCPDQVLACYANTPTNGEQPDEVELIAGVKSGDGDVFERLNDLFRCCDDFSPVPLEATVLDEVDFIDFGAALLSDGAVLVAGTELRPHLSQPSAELVVSSVMHSAFEVLLEEFPAGAPVPFPLRRIEEAEGWPALAGPALAEEGVSPPCDSTGLVETVTSIVRAMLAAKTGRKIPGKGAALAARYRETIGGPWCEFVEEVLRLGHKRPDELVTPEGEQRYRGLCERALDFGTEFVAAYRALLVRELGHPDASRRKLARIHIVRIAFPPGDQSLGPVEGQFTPPACPDPEKCVCGAGTPDR